MIIRRAFCVGAFAALLVGCQTNQGPMAPQSFTINTSKHKTKDAIVSVFAQNGYQITRDSEFQLVLDRPASDNFGAMMLAGSRFNGVPNARVTFTITGDNPTSVSTNLQLVTNPGSGFEIPNDLNGNADGRASVARGMALVKQRAEGK